jgi:hypothetical protein
MRFYKVFTTWKRYLGLKRSRTQPAVKNVTKCTRAERIKSYNIKNIYSKQLIRCDERMSEGMLYNHTFNYYPPERSDTAANLVKDWT